MQQFYAKQCTIKYLKHWRTAGITNSIQPPTDGLKSPARVSKGTGETEFWESRHAHSAVPSRQQRCSHETGCVKG